MVGADEHYIVLRNNPSARNPTWEQLKAFLQSDTTDKWSYFKESGRYVSVITDGGIRIGSDMCKAFAAGADGVVFGSILTRAAEAPGKGYHWGMSQPSATLPRGTRIRTTVNSTLERILFGPSSRTDGTENYVGALRNSMGVCGALTMREFQKSKLVIAPSIKTEGKYFQALQHSY